MLRIPVVVHLKGGNYDGFFNNANKAEQYFIKSMLHKVESIIVLSDKLMDMFDFDQSLLKKIKVVKNGFVGLNQLDPPVIEKAAPLHIIFLSNLIRSKGYLELIDAVKILTDKGKKIKLTLAGELMQSVDDNNGPLIDIPRTKEDLLRYIGNGYNISYVGTVEGDEKWNLLKNAHVMALPTRYIYEGQPVSIIEGLAYGLPILATDYKANSDMVSNFNGVLLDRVDAKEIAEKLNGFFDVSKLNAMRKNSYKLYCTEFTQENHLGNLENSIMIGDSS